IPVWAIPGNHDSPERIAYGGKMMEKAGIFMSRVFDGTLRTYIMRRFSDGIVEIKEREDCGQEDSGREVREQVEISLLPFLRPAQVRKFYPEKTIDTTQQAVEAVLEKEECSGSSVRILLMHQFVAGAVVCESEEISVGGSDQVDVSVMDNFDYVALGHLHRPQKVGRESVRYCGSPLKYSFSEADHEKTITVVETVQDQETDCRMEGNTDRSGRKRVRVDTIPLIPKLDLREIRGPMNQLLQPAVYRAANPEDYLHVTLTDEEEILDAIGKLREVYPNIMKLDFLTGSASVVDETEIQVEEKTPEQLFEEFFLKQNGREMNEVQKRVVREIWKGCDTE
ncbi:MAG: exonuclease SbcCD subunit D C-terminal domain-containing protein, partial [Candidatus Choladocola sp.]|nr:exonuclease SbcCD subunit D C-terminal domain-containing protein [Candidatus Choladocola sp.]